MIGSISYPLFDISQVEEETHFTKCRQHETEEIVYIKNEYIKESENGGYRVRTDVSCAQINVNKGDIVSVLDNTCDGYTLIKKDGFVGWITKDCLQDMH